MQVSMRIYGGKPSKWLLPHHEFVATTIWCYMTCIKKGFIEMVKGLLACFNKVFEVFKYLWSNSKHFVYFVNYR